MALRIPILDNFQLNVALEETQRNFFTFFVVISGNLCLRIPPASPFYWKLLRIGIGCAKAIRKDDLIFQV